MFEIPSKTMASLLEIMVAITFQPFLEKKIAISLPNPPEAPVISIVLISIDFNVPKLYFFENKTKK
jgi:hypothetical protein